MDFAVFWDLDGTLLSTGGKGWPCMIAASGNNPEHGPQAFSGLTDYEIMAKLVSRQPTTVSAEIDSYLNCLEAALIQNSVTRFGEAEAALNALHQEKTQSFIVTGNEPRGAKIKLSAAGFGASVLGMKIYGSSATRPSRIQIAKTAIFEENLKRGIFIGDSPNDVQAAKHIGWPCIAVATGHHSADELESEGAEVVLDHNYNSAALLDAIRRFSDN